MEWAIELALEYGKPVAATMCMGPKGDAAGISVGECGVRMARAGANLVMLRFVAAFDVTNMFSNM